VRWSRPAAQSPQGGRSAASCHWTAQQRSHFGPVTAGIVTQHSRHITWCCKHTRCAAECFVCACRGGWVKLRWGVSGRLNECTLAHTAQHSWHTQHSTAAGSAGICQLVPLASAHAVSATSSWNDFMQTIPALCWAHLLLVQKLQLYVALRCGWSRGPRDWGHPP
jgi:hypothetical protein